MDTTTITPLTDAEYAAGFPWLVPGDRATKNLKRHLAHSFPGVRFSVVAGRGCSSISVSWTGGPEWREVQGVCDSFQFGYFESLDDSYRWDRDQRFVKTFGGAMYVTTSKHDA